MLSLDHSYRHANILDYFIQKDSESKIKVNIAYVENSYFLKLTLNTYIFQISDGSGSKILTWVMSAIYDLGLDLENFP